MGEEIRSVVAGLLGTVGERLIRSMDVVSQRSVGTLPGRRYLVANGNGAIMIARCRRDSDKTGQRHASVFRSGSGVVDQSGKEVGANVVKLIIRRRGQRCCDDLRGRSVIRNSIGANTKASISPATGRRDEDGYYWIVGRIDDVLNVAGHRLGTSEIESALVSHIKVAEAAVVGRPDELKGQAWSRS